MKNPVSPNWVPPVTSFRPFVEAGLEQLRHPRELSLGDQGPEIGLRVEPVTKLQRVRVSGDPLHHAVVDVLVDVEPRTGGVGLAAVQQHRLGDAGNGALQVRVREDEDRALATQLEAHALKVARCRPRDRLAGRGAAGEADLVDVRVIDQGRARGPVAGHDVEDAIGQAGLLANIGQYAGR